MEKEELVQTVIKAQQGDNHALKDLYLDMYRSVYFLTLRFVKNPEDAEDITQDVYITMQQKIAELREPLAFFGWVNQIAVNKCKRFLDKYKGISRLDDDEEILNLAEDDPMNLPDKALDNEATRKIILDVIDSLPDGQRICILMYYYTQNTVAQIADILEVNENTVKSRLALARSKIRAALEEKADKEGIKLWGIPIALTPILHNAAESFTLPAGVAERVINFISKATVEAIETGLESAAISSASGEAVAAAGSNVAQSAVKAGVAISAKNVAGVAIGVILAGAVTVTGIMTLPSLFGDDNRVSQEEYDRAIEELERLREAENNAANDTSELQVVDDIPSPTPKHETPSPSPENAPSDDKWKQIYNSLIIDIVDYVNNVDINNHDWDGYYPNILYGFGLIDLNFDGIPELLVCGPGDMATGVRIFTINSDELDMILNFYSVPRFSLYKRISDNSLVISMDTSEGDGGHSSGTIHLIDAFTKLDTSFFDATMIASFRTEAGVVGTYYFNGIEVSPEEYIQLKTDIYTDYDELENSLFKWEERWHPDNSAMTLDEFLDSFVPLG